MEESFSKEKQLGDLRPARYLRARERYYRDAISKLPDSLISQALSCLPTKEAVQTSVLSTRWKSLWLLIPKLYLASSEFPDYNAFVGFVDRFLDFSREDKSILHELKLSIGKDENHQSCLTRWIHSVASPKLKHLDVECLVNRKFVEPIPQSLFLLCDTLVYLRLNRVSLLEYESVSLPCLKTMRLEHNVYASDACVESLISSCPVLQDLSIVRMVPDNIKFLRVRSQTLTTFHTEYLFGEGDDFDDSNFEKQGSGVLIDAPRLKYLKFEDELSDSKIITNSGSLTKVNVVYVFGEIDDGDVVDLPKRNMVRNFFTSISRVKEMKISLHTMEFLEFNTESYPLPQFLNVSTLKLTFSLSNLGMMPTVLESFPNLKSLVLLLEYIPSREYEEVRLSPVPVPQCLLSSLESVEIKRFDRGPANMEIARYFLENSLVLKKLVPRLRFSMVEEVYMLRDLLTFPRRSGSCQILVR